MPKLRSLSGREVRKILEAHGFRLVSQTGSHMKMQFKSQIGTVTAIVPDHKEIQTGTLSSIIRQAGIGRKPFED